MSLARRCSRTACGRPAVATLTYVYSDQTAVLGPLATYAEPHAYDLCEAHGQRLSAPRGWEVLRLDTAPPNSDKGPCDDSDHVVEEPVADEVEDDAVLRTLKAPAATDKVSLVLGDALRAPFADGSFDTVVTPWLIDIISDDRP